MPGVRLSCWISSIPGLLPKYLLGSDASTILWLSWLCSGGRAFLWLGSFPDPLASTLIFSSWYWRAMEAVHFHSPSTRMLQSWIPQCRARCYRCLAGSDSSGGNGNGAYLGCVQGRHWPKPFWSQLRQKVGSVLVSSSLVYSPRIRLYFVAYRKFLYLLTKKTDQQVRQEYSVIIGCYRKIN